MPQTSNSLLSPTNGPLNDGPLKFFEYQPPKIGIIPQNMSQTSNSLLSSTKSIFARGNQW